MTRFVGILHLTSFIKALRVVLVAKLVISGNLSSIFFTLALYSVFLTTSIFTKLLSLLKSTGTVTNLSIYLIYLLYFSNCLNYLLHFLIHQYLISTSDFNLSKSIF